MNETITAAPKRKPWFPIILLVLLAALLTLAAFWWWHNRPIQPVVLSPAEKEVVQAKVETIQKAEDPKYEKGAKEIVLTERELNGLLNENTSLGKSLSFELATDAIHARLETDLDKDLPFVGGKHLKARARILVKGAAGGPSFVLDDVTVWGVSLPNDWLGGLKGHDLLGEVIGGEHRKIGGVEDFKVETGRMVIRLKD